MSNELIRKTDVLDLLNELYPYFEDYEAYSILFDDIDNMKPANAVEPRTGRWEKTLKSYEDEEQAFDYYEITCSECRGESESEYHLTRFCPSCGAKMKGE